MRNLYAPLRDGAEFRAALSNEPWHMPHLSATCGGDCGQDRHCNCAPAPAEAATDIGADDNASELPEGAAIAVMIVVSIVALAVVAHGIAAGWLLEWLL